MTRQLAVCLAFVLLFPAVSLAADPPAATPAAIDGADTAWMLVSTGLVLLMVPGLALFYGGIVRRKNLLGTMMHSMVALGVIGVQWVLFGYMLSFGSSQGGVIGWNTDLLGLNNVLSNQPFATTKVPIFVHCMYQGMFAIITPALISGAIAERIRFGPYCLFIFLWSTFVYCPLAHWVWAVDGGGNAVGWIGKLGALDFAGGTVVHVAAGVSGLAAILMLRKRIGYPQHAMHPNSMVLTLFGAGLLWFGWFGFNGGSGMGSGAIAGSAVTATQCAAAAAALVWTLVEWLHRGKPTGLGFATGLVAGLVAITPASGFVEPWAALVIGAVSSIVCYLVVTLKPKLKYDDSLDAFGVHGVGGLLGALLTGVFASKTLYKASTGADITALVESGRMALMQAQVIATAVAVVFSLVMTVGLIKIIDLTMGFCLSPEAENEGLDTAIHGEVAFDFGLVSEMSDASAEPRPATIPASPVKRYTVVVEGTDNGELMHAWSDLCQAGETPPSREFLAVYPHVTTVQGNRFRFTGGEPSTVSQNLLRLFETRLRDRKLVLKVEL